jgi:hypothetical protein
MNGNGGVTDFLALVILLALYLKGAIIGWVIGGWWLLTLLPPFGVLVGLNEYFDVFRPLM